MAVDWDALQREESLRAGVGAGVDAVTSGVGAVVCLTRAASTGEGGGAGGEPTENAEAMDSANELSDDDSTELDAVASKQATRNILGK